jgi:CheY-like chemotaxis protein
MYQLLFVDDDLETLKEYAETVSTFTKLRAFICSSKTDALEAVGKYPIAVAVLDQKMPEITGTELYKELLKINPNLRAIMLSGEANESEIGDAMELHFSRYLHKSKVRELPAIVLTEFVKFQAQAVKAMEFERIYLFTVKHWFGLRGSTDFYLESIVVEDEEFVPSDSWKLLDQVNCGQKKRITEKVELSSELRFVSDLETEISANMEIAFEAAAKIKGKLGSVLRTKTSFSDSLKQTMSRETVQEIALPEEPQNPGTRHVKSRSFYWAPVYRKIHCHMSKHMKLWTKLSLFLLRLCNPQEKSRQNRLIPLMTARHRM